MTINDIRFPNELIDSIHNNTLVVFAGAGVSRGEPTGLPNFEELTNEIALGTGQTRSAEEPFESFLGRIKAGENNKPGPDVNQFAANILKNKCQDPNRLHKSIVNLFSNDNNVKIITTNYDQMFEKVYPSNPFIVYDAPALPLGSDIKGIVHLHGNVNNPKYMVVTDEDFGNAYLTDGYASRFLVEVFSNYDVLFIGYSFNDTVLRYLTKAMSRKTNKRKWILTGEDNYKSLI